jgi:hypothetical protein
MLFNHQCILPQLFFYTQKRRKLPSSVCCLSIVIVINSYFSLMRYIGGVNWNGIISILSYSLENEQKRKMYIDLVVKSPTREGKGYRICTTRYDLCPLFFSLSLSLNKKNGHRRRRYVANIFDKQTWQNTLAHSLIGKMSDQHERRILANFIIYFLVVG